jgi:hypothetical protein
MKKITQILSLVTLTATLFIFSCKKKVEDAIYVALPTENITTYTGNLGYTGTGAPIANLTGTATITQSDKVVNITFSDNIPAVTGIKFIKNGNDYASVSENGSVAGISFTGNTVKIAVTKDGGTWAFSGTK